MELPLTNFENYINETILKRGLQYFKKGNVGEPELISPGEFEAVVQGTMPYTVKFKIKNDIVTEHVCSCPYDMGPVCKHVAAVLFYLQKDELNLNVKQTRKKIQGKVVPKKKTVNEQIDELLDNISYNDLKIYVKELCMNNSNFRQLFITHNAHLIQSDSKELYTKQIWAILKNAAGRKGFIDYYSARQAGKEVFEFINTAQKLLQSGNYKTATNIACAVLEEMTAALDYADDSSGDIGDSIRVAIDVLAQLTDEKLDEALRVELFNYFINTYKKEIFIGWDHHFYMLENAVHLVKNNQEANLIHSLLDKVKPPKDDMDWGYNEAQQIKLELLKKTGETAKATSFIEENLSNSDFRKLAIETAIKKKDFTKAIALAEEGFKKDEKKFPGLALDWYDYLLKINALANNSQNVIKYARYLFLNSNREKKVYYDILKDHINIADWVKFIDDLVQEIQSKSRGYDYYTIAQIYIWEEQWDKLLSIIKRNPHLRTIENYEAYLQKDYSNELSSLYQNAVLIYLEKNIGRNHYQEACRYLRRIIKLGARDKANAVIIKLRELYPNRKALMEELDNV